MRSLKIENHFSNRSEYNDKKFGFYLKGCEFRSGDSFFEILSSFIYLPSDIDVTNNKPIIRERIITRLNDFNCLSKANTWFNNISSVSNGHFEYWAKHNFNQSKICRIPVFKCS